jgi:hypothetical protein
MTVQPALLPARASRWPTSPPGKRAGRRSSRCVVCAPTSTETPIERGSVTRCDGRRVNRGHGSGSRASSGGCPGASLPRVRGSLDQADRRPARPLSGDGQGVLLRPDRGKGASHEGPLRRRLSWLWRVVEAMLDRRRRYGRLDRSLARAIRTRSRLAAGLAVASVMTSRPHLNAAAL